MKQSGLALSADVNEGFSPVGINLDLSLIARLCHPDGLGAFVAILCSEATR